MIGCSHGAKNKTTTNYLYLAEKCGAVVHDMQEVHELNPLDDGGFEVVARHPGTLAGRSPAPLPGRSGHRPDRGEDAEEL